MTKAELLTGEPNPEVIRLNAYESALMLHQIHGRVVNLAQVFQSDGITFDHAHYGQGYHPDAKEPEHLATQLVAIIQSGNPIYDIANQLTNLYSDYFAENGLHGTIGYPICDGGDSVATLMIGFRPKRLERPEKVTEIFPCVDFQMEYDFPEFIADEYAELDFLKVRYPFINPG